MQLHTPNFLHDAPSLTPSDEKIVQGIIDGANILTLK